MTLSISQLLTRVLEIYPEAKQLDQSVIRFMKTVNENPYAVYYLAIVQELPNTQKELIQYLDSVIGSHYFKGRTNLQWSTYLFFITNLDRLQSGELNDAKELIERDRNYARKFVISEDEIDRVLTPKVVISKETTPQSDILSIWTEQLVHANLDQAILNDNNLPKRLKLIGIAPTEAIPQPQKSELVPEISRQPFLRSLRLDRFRPFPIRRDFRFGGVNLIVGPNGTGKTSLLEAIELLYCGRNKRNPNIDTLYALNAEFDDDSSEPADNFRNPQVFRDHNLQWYGRSEVRTNNLCQSFAQFNFLDTDAAVNLADSADQIEKNLSNLLVGSKAAEVWLNIKKVIDEIGKELRSLNNPRMAFEDEIGQINKLLAEASTVKHKSDSINKRLLEMVSRLEWQIDQDSKESLAASLVEQLSELISITEQAIKIEWISSPVSMENLAVYCNETKLKIEKVKTDLGKLDKLSSEQIEYKTTIDFEKQVSSLLEDLKPFYESDISGRVAAQKNIQIQIALLSDRLAGISPSVTEVFSDANTETNLADLIESLRSQHASSEGLLSDAQKEYDEFSKLKEESLNLSQQLREIASNIIQSSPNPDECPLCHSQFSPGDLEKHINMGVDDHLEELGQGLLNQLRKHESGLKDIIALETAANTLFAFCEQEDIDNNTLVGSILVNIEGINLELEAIQARLNILNSEIESLEAKGLSPVQFEDTLDRLHQTGYQVEVNSIEDVSKSITHLAKSIGSQTRKLDSHYKESAELQAKIRIYLGLSNDDSLEFEQMLSRIEERLSEAETIKEHLMSLIALFVWPDDKPLSELLVEIRAIQKVASDLQVALKNETQAKSIFEESLKRKKDLEHKLADILPEIDRLSSGKSSLEKIKEEHALENALESSLRENRDAFNTIFSQIHSPAEFSGLGSSWSTLIRIGETTETNLSQISSGQRAAFALSVFLAQNAQSEGPPPLVLLDDPIAHVDDMNSLSFLDYLREVALRGKRQIFFATANDKIAALFERKFDFMGPEAFCRFNLTR